MAAVEEAPKKWCLAFSDELVREGNRSVLKDEPAECRKLGFEAAFDVTTGELISPPAPLGVAIYPVRIAGDDVEVEIRSWGHVEIASARDVQNRVCFF